MSGPPGCGEVRRGLGVYLLGAIGPADRAAVDGHLAWCAACREEVAGLAGLPGLLSSVPVADAALLDAGEGGATGLPADPALAVLLARAARLRVRLRWRWLATVAAAALLAAATAIAGSRALQHPASVRQASAAAWAGIAHGSDPASGAAATVRYQPQPWGAQLQVQVSGIRAGTQCQLQIVSAGGKEATAGGWVVTAGRPWPWYPASAPFALSDVRRFLVTSAGRTLVSVPRP